MPNLSSKEITDSFYKISFHPYNKYNFISAKDFWYNCKDDKISYFIFRIIHFKDCDLYHKAVLANCECAKLSINKIPEVYINYFYDYIKAINKWLNKKISTKDLEMKLNSCWECYRKATAPDIPDNEIHYAMSAVGFCTDLDGILIRDVCRALNHNANTPNPISEKCSDIFREFISYEDIEKECVLKHTEAIIKDIIE